MKLLKPSLREKKRYVLFQIRGSSWEESRNEILAKIKSFAGDFLFGISGIMVVENLSKGSFFVLKVNRKYINLLKASIIFINEANNQKVQIVSLLVSGSLLKIKRRIQEVKLNGSK